MDALLDSLDSVQECNANHLQFSLFYDEKTTFFGKLKTGLLESTFAEEVVRFIIKNYVMDNSVRFHYKSGFMWKYSLKSPHFLVNAINFEKNTDIGFTFPPPTETSIGADSQIRRAQLAFTNSFECILILTKQMLNELRTLSPKLTRCECCGAQQTGWCMRCCLPPPESINVRRDKKIGVKMTCPLCGQRKKITIGRPRETVRPGWDVGCLHRHLAKSCKAIKKIRAKEKYSRLNKDEEIKREVISDIFPHLDSLSRNIYNANVAEHFGDDSETENRQDSTPDSSRHSSPSNSPCQSRKRSRANETEIFFNFLGEADTGYTSQTSPNQDDTPHSPKRYRTESGVNSYGESFSRTLHYDQHPLQHFTTPAGTRASSCSPGCGRPSYCVGLLPSLSSPAKMTPASPFPAKMPSELDFENDGQGVEPTLLPTIVPSINEWLDRVLN
eukprot:jgi/Bigna1/82865/fgenesh1_pg.98_\